MATIGTRIARGRVKAKYSQSKLAQSTGVTRSWIGAVETDRIERPEPAKLRRIADELGLDYRELLGLTNQLSEVPTSSSVQPSESDIALALNALTAAMQAQAEAMKEIVAEMKKARESTQGRSEGMAVALGDLSNTLASLRPLLGGKPR